MSGSYLSQSWYRVAELKPRLRPHAKVYRQTYRRRAWYLLQDVASNKVHRFTPAAYSALSLMDGEHSVAQIWDRLANELGAGAPTQDDLIQLLAQLHGTDVLQTELAPDVLEEIARGNKQRKPLWLKNAASPLSIRVPLWDLDRFLEGTYPWVAWMFGWVGCALWVAVVVPAVVLVAQHWSALTLNVSDQILATSNLLWLVLVFPAIKLLHELGHAYAVKSGGGEVHELGVMFLVLMPVPYVDASASSAFRGKWHRAMVGAAGMWVELFIAALAVFVWVNVEPGLLRAQAYNVIFLVGMSTLIFNGNPLLRFDGYHVLSDLLEVPNLGNRANRHWGHLVQRFGFGRHNIETEPMTRGEKFWLTVFAPAAFIYRVIVTFGIALFVASQFFFIGVALAMWSVVVGLVWPAVKNLAFVFNSPQLHLHRARAISLTCVLLLLAVAVCGYVPFPLRVQAQGVAWIPEDAELRADTPGFVERLLVQPGDIVKPGGLVLESRAPEILAEARSQFARVERWEVERLSGLATDRLQATLAHDELAKERATLQNLDAKLDGLIVRARAPGRVIIPGAIDLPGRFLKRGELFGYVLEGPLRTVRVVLPQRDAALVRNETKSVRLKLVDRVNQTVPATIVREVPGASQELPSKALTLEGGGEFALDPRDQSGTKTLERIFQLDLALPDSVGDLALGTRALVQFELTPEPLVYRWYRQVRRLLLSHFNV